MTIAVRITEVEFGARDTIEDVSKGSGEAYLDLIIDTATTVTDLEVAGSTLRATPRARTEVAAVPETRKEPELSRSPQGPVKKGTSEMSQKRKEKKVHSFDSYTPPKNKGPHRRSSERACRAPACANVCLGIPYLCCGSRALGSTPAPKGSGSARRSFAT